MNIYINILKLLLNKEYYDKYYRYVNKEYVKDNLPDLNKLFSTLERRYSVVEAVSGFSEGKVDAGESNQNSRVLTLDSFELLFYKDFPLAKKEVYNKLFELLRSSDASEESVLEYLETARKREIAVDLARKAIDFGEGKANLNEVNDIYQILLSGLQIGDEQGLEAVDQGEFVSSDLRDIVSSSGMGLRWRLASLNLRLGSLRTGDFGFLFARPERGKTTFLASEVTHMASQIPDDGIIIWFNNEEQSRKVMRRCYQAALGKTLTEIMSDTDKAVEEYNKLTNNKIKIVRDCNTKTAIEAMCLKYRPKLMIFDQIDKINGFDDERYDLKMKAIYAWVRGLAKTYGPAIGVCQAGGTADGKKYLNMNDVDSSHTAKQGEADWMLGIGATYEAGMEEVRYFSLCKNKLEGDHDFVEELRHDQWVVKIKPTIARYEDY